MEEKGRRKIKKRKSKEGEEEESEGKEGGVRGGKMNENGRGGRGRVGRRRRWKRNKLGFPQIYISLYFSNPNILQFQIDKVKDKVNSGLCVECPFALIIIDDNDFNIIALKLLLSKLDIIAFAALSVDEGMKKIKDLANKNGCTFFKIIFLDIEMPIKDGFVGYAEISEFYKNSNFDFLNIVAVTAHNPSSDIVKNVETKCGIEVYSKPLSQEDLLLIIKKTLKKYKKFVNE